MRADEMDIDLVEVTAHYGARPSHAEWQGQVYSRSGNTKGYDKFEDATGYGTVEGLCGANCRHNFYPFFEGISKRSYTREQLENMKNHKVVYNDQEMTDYDASQLQRRMERSIRTSKQELVMYDEAKKNVTTDEEKALWQQEFNNTSVKLKSQEARLKDFCNQTGRYLDTNRTQAFAVATENGIKNYGRSVSQKAVWANKKGFTYGNNNVIINKNDNLPRITRISSSTITEKINNGTYGTNISIQQYYKHVEGTPQFELYKSSRETKGNSPQSILTISIEEAQKIINTKAGTGIVDVDRKGVPKPKEYVSCDKIIGKYFAGGKYHDTTKCAIHYGKKKSHIVPVKGDFYD